MCTLAFEQRKKEKERYIYFNSMQCLVGSNEKYRLCPVLACECFSSIYYRIYPIDISIYISIYRYIYRDISSQTQLVYFFIHVHVHAGMWSLWS